MKLYYSAQRASDPDSADPWQVPGKQDKAAERVDVPSSPGELAAWLNERGVPSDLTAARPTVGERSESDELEPEQRPQPRDPRVPGFCDACGRSAEGTLKLSQGNDLDAINRWMETAELWAIQRMIEHARDVIRGRSAALDGQGVQ